jgi:stromal membrane-associated protein
MGSQGPNEVANQELEYHVPAEFKKPTSRASRETRSTYITAKYATKSFGRRPVCEDAAEAGAGAGETETTERERLPPVFSDEEVAPCDKSIGELEFIGILLVKLVECTNLEKADFLGKSDPYVLLTTGHQTVKSKKIANTLNPRFDETLMLSWDGASTLIAQVMDHDTFKKHDPLGSITLAIADEEELVHGGTLVIADRPLEGVSRGKITLEITFQRL